MKRIYFIAPMVALALFAIYSWHFNQEFEAKEEAKAATIRSARDNKLKSEAEARKKAMSDAIASQEKLKKDRLDREAEEVRKKEARQASIDARDRGYREQEKLARQVERIKKDIRVEEEALTKLDGSIKYAQGEKTFENEFIGKAKQNVAALAEILTKIDAAEAARAAGAAQAPKTSS
jgi:hypothetical protein